MLPRHQTAAAQALYRVFISPTTWFPAHICVAAHKPHALPPSTTTHGQRRALSKYRKVTPVSTPSVLENPSHPINEAINSPMVHLSKDGKLQETQTLQSLIWEAKTLNEKREKEGQSQLREKLYVRQYAMHGDGSPVVKLVTHGEIWEQSKLEKTKTKTKTVEERSKQLELNWALEHQDLQHRLVRLREFLGQGRRVEVLLARKKRGRRATLPEMEALLDQIYAAAREVPGLDEIKPLEGTIGGMATLTFSINESLRAQLASSEEDEGETKEDKQAKKNREKEERRAKEAERQRKAEERAMELERQRTIKVEDL